MRGSYSGCVRKNLKTWITVVIVAQFLVVLLYLDMTRTVTSSSLMEQVRHSVFGEDTANIGAIVQDTVVTRGDNLVHRGVKDKRRFAENSGTKMSSVSLPQNIRVNRPRGAPIGLPEEHERRMSRTPLRDKYKNAVVNVVDQGKLSNNTKVLGTRASHGLINESHTFQHRSFHKKGQHITPQPDMLQHVWSRRNLGDDITHMLKDTTKSKKNVPWKYQSRDSDIGYKAIDTARGNVLQKTVASVFRESNDHADSKQKRQNKLMDGNQSRSTNPIKDKNTKTSKGIREEFQSNPSTVKLNNDGVQTQPELFLQNHTQISIKNAKQVQRISSDKGYYNNIFSSDNVSNSYLKNKAVFHYNNNTSNSLYKYKPVDSNLSLQNKLDIVLDTTKWHPYQEQQQQLDTKLTSPRASAPGVQGIRLTKHVTGNISKSDQEPKAKELSPNSTHPVRSIHSPMIKDQLTNYIVNVDIPSNISRHNAHRSRSTEQSAFPIRPVDISSTSKLRDSNHFLRHRVLHLTTPVSTQDLFLSRNGIGCYIPGTEMVVGRVPNQNETGGQQGFSCKCKSEWHGLNCSIPDMFYFSSGAGFMRSVKPRSHFRRVINALAFNVEFDLLEARLHELSEVVDVFILFESNFSNFGEEKPLRLLNRLQKGYLKVFHHKIVYVMRDYFPAGGKDNGWLVDEHMRTFISREGLSRVADTNLDDLFIYTDADELPSRDAIQFLRMHDGYPEPFGFTLRWSVFGFFWKQFEPTRIYAGCTMAMMRYVFLFSAFELRVGDYFTKHGPLIQAYVNSGAEVYEWHLGETSVPAGWHCSWCLPPEGIQVKLTSAINADFPRWGDYPHKRRLDYIRHLISNGIWFDDVMKFDSLSNAQIDPFYAPKYLLANHDKYKGLLELDKT